MHIPDGFLDAKTVAATSVLAVVGVGVALRQARLHLPRRQVPLVGLMAAFVFAGQMVNFPVLGGTSGHLVGAVLAAVLLGPSAAILVMTTVLIVQAFVFADGGITTLGANVLNMAILGSVVGSGIHRLCTRVWRGPRSQLLAAGFAAWGTVVLASALCAGELALSGTVRAGLVFPAMLSVHALIGVGEALITALALSAIARTHQELLAPAALPLHTRAGEWVSYGLLIALGIALFVAPFACGFPDGLEHTATVLGFEGKGLAEPLVAAPVAEYKFAGIASEGLATALAGALGTLLVFGLLWLGARTLVAARKPADESPTS